MFVAECALAPFMRVPGLLIWIPLSWHCHPILQEDHHPPADTQRDYVGGKFEYVYDNTVVSGLNFLGTRAKASFETLPELW